ncbi:MAG TPA: DUF3160 domain-containing protein [Polyangiaceae bacterium]|nr:DUF3160 domain-containing protein [Polyangiaceae bacterium]
MGRNPCSIRALSALALVVACSSGGGPGAFSLDPPEPSGSSGSGGTGAAGSSGAELPNQHNPVPDPVGTRLPELESDAARLAEFDQLQGDLKRLRGLNASELLDEYPVQQLAELDYVPSSAEFMDRIQASALALDSNELAVLDRNGFVVSARQQFPTFLRGYAAIYMEHLPVYVSADALLEAVHSSYDLILARLEQAILAPQLRALLDSMLARVDGLDAPVQTRADLRLYLEVAAGLLKGSASGVSSEARSLIEQAREAQGIGTRSLFGVDRRIDFSQFTPRGHYTDELQDYFRAMIWLGRIELRLIETEPDGTAVFRRPQYEAMLGMQQLMNEPALQRWSQIEQVVHAFVGESDSMTVPEVAALVADLGGPESARSKSDAEVAQAINAGGYGAQRIASQLMVNDGTVKTLPLDRSFLLFGQRYVPDSHVFSAVVYDRIADRMLPNPLDAAFAAFGNNQALRLEPDLQSVPELPGALGGMRRLIDDYDASFWSGNLYNAWSAALRALSPAGDLTDPASAGLPRIAGTEAWGRRLLNTQLGSWAELRHDTLLYAKQSYTGIPGCEFPDAYVEPYPEFFAALVRYAERGAEVAAVASSNEDLGPALTNYFAQLRSTAALLGQMAEQQRSGTPHTAEQLAFINDAVRVEQESVGCSTIEVPDGWYASLFFDPNKSIEEGLTIADVHTQPADPGGNIVGNVLHVGTGYPRLLTVTIDTCAGPRAYAGMAYSYHELVKGNFERLTDERWAAEAVEAAEVPWAQGFIGGGETK